MGYLYKMENKKNKVGRPRGHRKNTIMFARRVFEWQYKLLDDFLKKLRNKEKADNGDTKGKIDGST